MFSVSPFPSPHTPTNPHDNPIADQHPIVPFPCLSLRRFLSEIDVQMDHSMTNFVTSTQIASLMRVCSFGTLLAFINLHVNIVVPVLCWCVLLGNGDVNISCEQV